MKTVANTTALALALLALAACGGKILYPKYYSMEIPPPPAHSANARVLGTVAVRQFESAPYIRQKKIVYRPVPEEIGFYEYHRWVNDPAEMVTSAMIESLRSSGLFSSVTQYNAQSQQNYLMAGRLGRLEETDYGGHVSVTAKLSAELVNLRTGSTDWTGDAAVTLKVDERSVNSVVIELGHAVQKSIDELITSLGQQTR